MDKREKNDKKLFDFKDLMAFGMFILVSITDIHLLELSLLF